MTTAVKLIEQALGLIGVRAAGETLDGDTVTDSLQALNDLIDSWATEAFYVYQVLNHAYTLSSNQQTVTIGPGGDIDVPVPFLIASGAFTRRSGIDYPIKICGRAEYNAIIMKTSGTSWPSVGCYEREYPLAKLLLWPLPSDAYELNLPLWYRLGEFASPAEDIFLPPGYRRALTHSLAEELAPSFGREPSALLLKNAARARANVKRVNRSTPMLQARTPMDSGERFNIYSGQ